MYVLFLNDMRSSNIENLQKVCRSETKEGLQNFIKQEETEPYRDGQWGKVYKKEGHLNGSIHLGILIANSILEITGH